MTDASDTRSEIIDAAYAVLVERGYDGFTTKAVADRAGRNQSLVHYYFDTKRDLLLGLFEDGLADIDVEVEALATDDDPTSRLLSLATFMVGTDTGEDDFKRVLLELRAQAPYHDELRDVLERDREFLEGFVADIVEEGIERGEFRDVDVETFAATYVTTILGAQTNIAVFGEDAHAERAVAGLEDIVDGYLVRDGE